MSKSKKGQGFTLAAMSGLAIALVVGYLTAAISANVVDEVDNTFTDDTTAANLTFQGQQALQPFADFASIIGLTVVASVVLGIVRTFL